VEQPVELRAVRRAAPAPVIAVGGRRGLGDRRRHGGVGLAEAVGKRRGKRRGTRGVRGKLGCLREGKRLVDAAVELGLERAREIDFRFRKSAGPGVRHQ
jgi:hypothetical protein